MLCAHCHKDRYASSYMPKLLGFEVVPLRFSIYHMRNLILKGNDAIAEESLAFMMTITFIN
jgi:hypothetical protein